VVTLLRLNVWSHLKSHLKLELGAVFCKIHSCTFIQKMELSYSFRCDSMEQRTLKNVNNYLNTNIYSYLETSGVQSFNLYLNVVYFLTPELIRHLWQLKTVVFLHWCLICALLFITIIAMNLVTL
jgi:hypothetical protein